MSLASLEISLEWATYLELRSAEEQAAGSPRPPPCPVLPAAQAGTTDSGLRPLQHLDARPCESRQVLSTLTHGDESARVVASHSNTPQEQPQQQRQPAVLLHDQHHSANLQIVKQQILRQPARP
jgi:hypothetical protein